MNHREIKLADIRSAMERVRDRVRQTPIHSAALLNERTGLALHFKCENIQQTGSFKVRGVLNKMLSLDEASKSKGVVTVSAGNHAQAMAWASAAAGVPCTVVMPETASATKVSATRAYGAEVILPGDVFAAFETMHRIAHDEGKVMIHPFEDELIIAGHGTMGLEVLEQVDDIDAIVVGIGGGALISGISIAVKEQHPDIKIFGVEPEGANAMSQSLAAGRPLQLDKVGSIADGLAPPMAGKVPFGIIQKYVDDVVSVSEAEIAQATRDLISQTKLVVEPAGAAATAAILSGKLPLAKESRVVSIVSGGNIDAGMLKMIMDKHIQWA